MDTKAGGPFVTNWRQYAECVGTPIDVFYDKWNEKYALSICAECRVSDQCLAETLSDEHGVLDIHIDGVRGGTTAEQRRRMRHKARRMAGV